MGTLKSQLSSLKKAQLIALIDAVYGIYGDIDEIVDRHLSSLEEQEGSDDTLGEAIHRQIQQLANEDFFIDNREAHSFSCRLESLLIDINTLVREQSPLVALQMLDEFFEISPDIMGRVDDSDGDVGEAFRNAVDIWLDIAQEIREKQPQYPVDWVSRIIQYFDNNDYGLFDGIISYSSNLLTRTELMQLAWRFENDLKKSLASSTGQGNTDYNSIAAHAAIGLQSVAEALEDMVLYEKATLLQNPQPNAFQMTRLVEFALNIGNYERAQYWLDQPDWSNQQYRRKELTNQLLREKGNLAQVKDNLRNDFESSPNYVNLLCYWKIANTNEHEIIRQTVEQLAPGSADITDSIEMLLVVGNVALAAETLIQRCTELTPLFYGVLTKWVAAFETQQQTLAAILCYRALLEDILQNSRNKAYHHGADYFNRLRILDRDFDDYQQHPDAKKYIRFVQEKHWRKRAFWEQASYPNKPE